MKLHVCSRRNVLDVVKSILPWNPVVISITDPRSEKINFQIAECNVLRLEFHDLEKDYPGEAPAIILFTKEMALTIRDFLFDRIWTDSKESITEARRVISNLDVIVHCEAGISRSPAVAAAISMHFNKNCDTYFGDASRYIPNKLVYKTLLDCINGRDNEVPVVKIVNKSTEIF